MVSRHLCYIALHEFVGLRTTAISLRAETVGERAHISLKARMQPQRAFFLDVRFFCVMGQAPIHQYQEKQHGR